MVKRHPVHKDYGATRDGRAWSRKSGEWRELAPRANKKTGYFSITADGKTLYIHRLVYECFNGQLCQGQVRHKDGNRANNRLSNLRCGSQSQNEMDKRRHGTDNRGERHPMHKLTEDDVRAIRRDPRLQRVIADEYRIARSLVSSIKSRKYWSHVR